MICERCSHPFERHDNPPGDPDPGWTDLDRFPCDCGECEGFQEREPVETVPDSDLSTLSDQATQALERAENATPGPWEWFERWHDAEPIPSVRAVESRRYVATVLAVVDDADEEDAGNAEFIAAARSDVPNLAQAILDLCDRTAAAEAEIERLRGKDQMKSAMYNGLCDEAKGLRAEVERLRESIRDIDSHAFAVGTDEDGFNSGGYLISIGSLHRALGLLGHTGAKEREHAVQLVTSHGDDCKGCQQAKEVCLDAVAAARGSDHA